MRSREFKAVVNSTQSGFESKELNNIFNYINKEGTNPLKIDEIND